MALHTMNQQWVRRTLSQAIADNIQEQMSAPVLSGAERVIAKIIKARCNCEFSNTEEEDLLDAVECELIRLNSERDRSRRWEHGQIIAFMHSVVAHVMKLYRVEDVPATTETAAAPGETSFADVQRWLDSRAELNTKRPQRRTQFVTGNPILH